MMNFKEQNIDSIGMSSWSRKAIGSIAALSLLLLLAACSNTSSSDDSSDDNTVDEDFAFTLEELEEMGVSIFDSADKLGDCSDENEFETVYVKADSSFYMCDEGEWSNDFSVEIDTLQSNEELGECSDDNEGEMFTIPHDSAATIYDTYACEDGEWVSDWGGNSGEKIDPKTVVKGSFKDERDGKTYRTVKIGTQIWMAENLNYKVSGSSCYGGKAENCKKYGRLYAIDAVQNVCPSGWKFPSLADWDTFINAKDNMVGYEDLFGADLLYGGYGAEGNSYKGIGKNAFYWTSSMKVGANSRTRLIRKVTGSSTTGLGWLAYIRCIKK